MSLTDLARLRLDPTPIEADDPWVPPRVEATILAFDQTLRSTGWVLLRSLPNRGPFIVRTGMLRTDAAFTGHEGSIRRGLEIRRLASQVIGDYAPFGTLVVMEQPPIAVGVFRPESSLLAAQAIAEAASAESLPFRFESAQRAKKLLTGNARASKAQVRAGVELLLPTASSWNPYNEHVVDALALALIALDPKDPS